MLDSLIYLNPYVALIITIFLIGFGIYFIYKKECMKKN